jgi:DNA-binding NtrC family response regulator
MADLNALNGKKVLIVDDESDIVESIEELLGMCDVSSSTSFETAKKLLESGTFDIAVLDIMGVDGYDLLSIANQKGITTVMLTAHALSPTNFAKCMDAGACAYLPKDKLSEIDGFLADILEHGNDACGLLGGWFDRLNEFFERKFGPDWLDE